MRRFKIKRKFTDIQITDVPLIACLFRNPKNIVAFVEEQNPKTLYLNKKCIYASHSTFWEEHIVSTITHEQIHIILAKLGVESHKLDNICGKIPQSNFLVDGDWEWLKYHKKSSS